jgi:hypothetical protein
VIGFYCKIVIGYRYEVHIYKLVYKVLIYKPYQSLLSSVLAT